MARGQLCGMPAESTYVRGNGATGLFENGSSVGRHTHGDRRIGFVYSLTRTCLDGRCSFKTRCGLMVQPLAFIGLVLSL